MAAFDLEEFKSTINRKGGLMRTNKFAVRFSVPRVLLGQVNDFREVQLFTDTVSHPGFLLATHDVRRWTYGPIEKRPWSPQFSQLQCSFYNTNDSRVWGMFDEWMQKIIAHNAQFGINTSQNGGRVYEMEYKQEYATDILITVFDHAGEVAKQIMCREAFPTQMPDIGLAWADNNSIFKFPVIFDYLDWYTIDNREFEQ